MFAAVSLAIVNAARKDRAEWQLGQPQGRVCPGCLQCTNQVSANVVYLFLLLCVVSHVFGLELVVRGFHHHIISG